MSGGSPAATPIPPGSPPSADRATGAQAKAARRLYDARRARNQLFGREAECFGEPSWDILLLLTALDEDGGLFHADLITHAGVDPSIAERHVENLASRGLVREAPHARGTLVSLTPRGRQLMLEYVEDHR